MKSDVFFFSNCCYKRISDSIKKNRNYNSFSQCKMGLAWGTNYAEHISPTISSSSELKTIDFNTLGDG